MFLNSIRVVCNPLDDDGDQILLFLYFFLSSFEGEMFLASKRGELLFNFGLEGKQLWNWVRTRSGSDDSVALEGLEKGESSLFQFVAR